MLNKEFYPKEQLALNPNIDPNATYGAITSADLTSTTTPISVVTPTQTPITTLNPEDFKPSDIQPTQPETDISKMIKDITGERTALAGESATFRAEEEKRLETEKLAGEEADLFSQLKQQQTEFENLQAEDVRIEERMQQQATGRGITAGGLQPLTAAELRKNFLIKSEKAAQVNVTAAILAGTQNKLLTAKSLLDSAIKNKFGAREAQLDAETENLKLLLQDPTLTISQTNRANAQIAKKEKEKAALDKKKEDSKKILDWAVEARQNGASALEAQEIANIGLSDNPDLNKAFEIYSKYAKEEEKPTGDIAEFKSFFPNVDITTPAGQQQFLNWTARMEAAKRVPVEPVLTIPADKVASALTSVGLSPAILTTGNKLTKGNADKIAAEGVPPSVVELITQAILEGNTLDKVRQALTEGYGKDIGFGYLDKYMNTLQSKEAEISNPFE